MVRTNDIPACFFPTTVLFVTTGKQFVHTIKSKFNGVFLSKIAKNTDEALMEVHTSHQHEQFQHQYQSDYSTTKKSFDNFVYNFDLSTLHFEVYNPQRFSEIAVIVVEDTEISSGVEFCKRMENSPIKRLLIIDPKNEAKAIKAFDDGIIDMYINKNTSGFFELLQQSILKLQRNYFQMMSEIIIKMLSINLPSCLREPTFGKLFNAIIEANNIVEYYITENSGSFILLNGEAHVSYLAIKTEREMSFYYDLAVCNQMPKAILQQLQNREKIPCFPAAEYSTPIRNNNWSDYLYPAEKIVGSNSFWYAYIKNPSFLKLQQEQICSYERYLQQRQHNAAGIATIASQSAVAISNEGNELGGDPSLHSG